MVNRFTVPAKEPAMNDLTFAATLLSLFATLVFAVVVEIASPASSAPAYAAPRTGESHLQLAQVSDRECARVALAAAAAR
jgi:hypothetical protein